MIERFAVRQAERGYGVWDAGTSGWRSRQDLVLEEAESQAAIMNGQERAKRVPPGPGLRQNPPKPCQVFLDGQWRTGFLTDWQQHSDGSWWGTGTCEEREWSSWVPATQLRPLT
jgi:hypothetical protein